MNALLPAVRIAAVVVSLFSLSHGVAIADAPQVITDDSRPKDRRFEPPKDLDGYFPFDVPSSKEEWTTRREELQRQVLVATGLWPMPPRPPIDAIVHGTVMRDDYTVSRVFFETALGLYVTGSLYKPAQGDGPFPTILTPHGHWSNGRFFDHGPEQVKKEIEAGAERFEKGGRYPLQARCVHLARMGCVVFQYDMLGYADSVPLTQELAHGFRTQRPELSTPEQWGLFSAQSELRSINALGLQTWNSIRALDWVTSLPFVDSSRIGVTGASGGGTQTFLLSAVDDRITAAFPAVMVSTAMQGGCTCENASYLRVGTGNIELAALTAPRPLAMSAANDWTKELETKGLPELKQLYSLLDVPDRVEGQHFDFGHNFNAVSRRMMYDFFKRHFKLDRSIEEQDFVPLTKEEMTVWTDDHPKPPMDEAAELELMRQLAIRDTEQLQALVPSDEASHKEYQRVVGGAFDVMLGRNAAESSGVAVRKNWNRETGQGYDLHLGLVQNTAFGEEIPTVVLLPNSWNKKAVIWPHHDGKAGLFTEKEEPIAPVKKLLEEGFAVVTADLIGQGEHTQDSKTWTSYRVVENPREFAGYTLGYNHPLFSQRVHDLLTLMQFTKAHGANTIILTGSDDAAAWAAAACVQSNGLVDAIAVNPNGFRFGQITEIRDPNLLPGAVKFGDLPALLALCAPTPLLVVGESDNTLQLTEKVYTASGKSDALETAESETPSEKLVSWIFSLPNE